MISNIKQVILHHETIKVSKFTIIGILCVFIDYFIFVFILSFKIAAPEIATTISYIVSAIFNFTLNKVWTFKNKDTRLLYQILTFIFIHIFCLSINVVMVHLGNYLRYEFKSPYLIILFKILADCIASIFSYIGNRFVIFSKKGKGIIMAKFFKDLFSDKK